MTKPSPNIPTNWEVLETRNGTPYTVCKVTDTLVIPDTKLPMNFRVTKLFDGTEGYQEGLFDSKWFDTLYNIVSLSRNPLIATQPKVDGIRCFVFGGVAYSASLRPLPNRNLQKLVSDGRLDGLDGELTHSFLGFRHVQSRIMSQDATLEGIQFIVFDMVHDYYDFHSRLRLATKIVSNWAGVDLTVLMIETFFHQIESKETLLDKIIKFSEREIQTGGEGLVIRSGLHLPYYFGRPPAGNPLAVKIKAVKDTEARIISVVQGTTNNNPLRDELDGTTSRGTKAEHITKVDTAGSLLVIGNPGTPFAGKTFAVSLGSLTHNQCKTMWGDRNYLIGKEITFKYFNFGEYELPRSPIFKSLRYF